MSRPTILKLGLIQGKTALFNEVISHLPNAYKLSGQQESELNKRRITVFFGGDVQDYPDNMASHRDHGKYLKWNLLNVITLLSMKFPNDIILIIKPNRMELKTFSCYDNFVTSDKLGSPTYAEGEIAIDHLKNLLYNSMKIINGHLSIDEESFSNKREDEIESCIQPIERLHHTNYIQSINMIGFSKGCVVLNQIITEVHKMFTSPSNENEHLRQFWKKVCSLYWLDGGHSGGKNTWITQKAILFTLASFPGLKINVHVTPYQVRDERRPWIGKECKVFVDSLRKAKADIHYQIHFENEIACLENHFRILDEFE